MSATEIPDSITERLNAYSSGAMPAREARTGEGVARKAGAKLSEMVGVEKVESFDFGFFASDLFRRHSTDEIEQFFAIGTPAAVPAIGSVDASWPRPWLFARALIASFFIYFLFRCAWAWFANANLLPGLIATGTIAIPLSVLIFFVEVNVRRNVSLYQVLRAFAFGGVLSLIFSLLLFAFPVLSSFSWMGASIAGIVEEPGKLAAVIAVANFSRYRYKLNGLLFGAAVGTGFAVFESMGYALNAFSAGGADMMAENILVRGVLSPFGHAVWTAIASAALWRVLDGGPFAFSALRSGRFLRLFSVPVVLHMFWNSTLEMPFYGKYLIAGAVAWFIMFALIQEGLKEVRAEKAGFGRR